MTYQWAHHPPESDVTVILTWVQGLADGATGKHRSFEATRS